MAKLSFILRNGIFVRTEKSISRDAISETMVDCIIYKERKFFKFLEYLVRIARKWVQLLEVGGNQCKTFVQILDETKMII